MDEILLDGIILAIAYKTYLDYSLVYSLLFLTAIWVFFNLIPRIFGYEPVKGDDSIWILDSETNKMQITTIGILEKTDPEVMINSLTKFMKADKRSTQYFTRILGKYYWKTEKQIDPMSHVTLIEEPFNKERLAHLLNEEGLISRDFPPGKSEWSLTIIANYEEDESVGIFRIHHALADGLSMVSSLVTSADSDCDKIFYSPPDIAFSKKVLLFLLSVFHFPFLAVTKLLMVRNKNDLHKEKLSGKKTMYWSDKLPIDQIKARAKEKKVTINDYICAAVIQSITEYCPDIGSITCYIPFSLRGQPKDGSALPLSNDFAPLLVRMPGDSSEIYQDLSHLFNSLKNSIEPFSTVLSMKIIGSLFPIWLAKLIMYELANKATVLFSNVPGPKTFITFERNKMKSIVPMSPGFGNIGVSITAVSYVDHVVVGCYSDEANIEHPLKIIHSLEQKLLNNELIHFCLLTHNEMERENFIVCMNCEDFIKTDLIEVHSLVCEEPHSEVFNMEQEDRSKFLHYKIEKLNCAIELLIEEKSIPPKILFFLRTLLIFSQGLFRIPVNSSDSVELCEELLEDLQKFNEKILSFPVPLLYADRIMVLGEEKLYIIMQYNNEKFYPFFCGENNLNIMRSVNSVMEGHSKMDSVFTAEDLYEEFEEENTERAEFGDSFSMENRSNEIDIRKGFYKICINQKLMYPSNHEVNNIELPLIYHKAMKNKIPEQNWEEFIKSEFENWHNWVN